ncbi:hypothetical protein [Curtobacterium sp. TXMA1]|uniref:hypothetical protein n=1 Tax=Curtobacterium sp. TXMA1 TaxID=2876939 RepID=UPI001CCFDAE4|nr:hypothetical protein [Curtobacterium sp. TXMA1]UBQ02529.1 hypothetical protein LCG91_16015 [Curtobacterium sp. TXMA1]
MLEAPSRQAIPAAWAAWDLGLWNPERQGPDRRLDAALDKYRQDRDHGSRMRARFLRAPKGPHRIAIEKNDGPHLKFAFSRDGWTSYQRRLREVELEDLVLSHPMREFSRHAKQEHKPNALWTHTNEDLLACESQRERRFALLADYDQRVTHIVAQPMTILFPAGSPFAIHTPDALVFAPHEPPVAVNIKTPDKALDPETVAVHDEVTAALAPLGIGHIVWTELPEVLFYNLGLLSKVRPDPLWVVKHRPGLLAALDAPMSVANLSARLAADNLLPVHEAQSLIQRLLWQQELQADLTVRYSNTATEVSAA